MEPKLIAHYEKDYLKNWILEAVKEGNSEEIAKRVEDVWDGFMSLRDKIVDIASGALTHIAKVEGEDAVYDTWKEITKDLKMDTYIPYVKAGYMTPEQYAQATVRTELSHGSALDLYEDDEKFMLDIKYCNICSRFADNKTLDLQGGYVGTVKEDHPWCSGDCGMPYYCVHAPIWFGDISKEADYDILDCNFGSKLDNDGNFVNTPCKEYIYKKPRE